MTQNLRTPAELKAALDAIVAELKTFATIADENLVPLAKSIQDVAAFGATLSAMINARVIVDGVDVPGAARKPSIAHRKWNDPEAAARAAYDQFGKAAFECSLKSPAGVEKLGPEGKAFVALASFKPDAPDRVVY
jgi:hypothetical protein